MQEHIFVQNMDVQMPRSHGCERVVTYLVMRRKFKAKKAIREDSLSLNGSLAMTYSHMGTPTLPSAQLRFTSEFGMGSGGATALLSLDKNLLQF